MEYLKKLRRLMPIRFKTLEPDMVLDLGRYVSLPEGYRPANPSIARYGDGFLVCVRGVSYTIDKKLRIRQPTTRLPSLNRLLLLDRAYQPKDAPTPRQAQFHCIEDLKLFNGIGRVWGIGSACVDDPTAVSARTMTLVEFNAALTDCRFIQLPSPFGAPVEKNWSPFFMDDILHFVYAFEPLVLIRYDTATAAVAHIDPQYRRRTSPTFLEGGSSAGVATGVGTIFLTHRRVVRLPDRQRIYLNRLRCLRGNQRDVPAGPFFSIGRPTIQFANGMLFEDDRVLITYGEMDAAARLACFPRHLFERAVFPPV